MLEGATGFAGRTESTSTDARTCKLGWSVPSVSSSLSANPGCEGDVVPELPDHPDLDQLRRQARELHRAAQASNPDAVARLRAVSDDVSLAAAQLALAREYGFSSWPGLKSAVEEKAKLSAAPASSVVSGSSGNPAFPKCSFCGKSTRQVKKLIAGRGVYICDECVGLCQEIIDDEQRQDSLRGAPGTVDPLAMPEILEGSDAMTVRVRLAEEPGPWTKEYLPIARLAGLDAAVIEEPGQILLVVKLREFREPEIFDALDRALLLVGDAREAARNHEAVGHKAQRLVNRWWQQKTQT